MSVYVIRAFVRIREEIAANAAILKRLAEIDKTLLVHDVALREMLEKLRPLLAPPPLPPKPQIGFHVKEDAVPYRAGKRGKAEVQSCKSERLMPQNFSKTRERRVICSLGIKQAQQ
jgi:hypothetical protein